MISKMTARQLDISGVVQGVGFRPFIFVLANTFKLSGQVSNTTEGVRVVVEGLHEDIDAFSREIIERQPLLAKVENIKVKEIDPQGFTGFNIVKSRTASSRNTLISPDVSICPDCLGEIKDPDDRRYGYPFINCTNCGPRFTIIEDIPYDRSKTSMKTFVMCQRCQAEYDNPLDRRFHAQPNACPECGPHVTLVDKNGGKVCEDGADAISLAARYLQQGKIVAVKGLGGFHLACDATHSPAVENLRRKKNRPHKPFALMAESGEAVSQVAHLCDAEKKVLESYHRPIVLLEKKIKSDTAAPQIADQVAPFNTCLGFMLPYTPLHCLLLEKGPDILVMTSGNRSGEPLSIDNQDALDAFGHIADFFLMHNRDIYFRADDSIVKFQADKIRFIRRSRGYAPLPVSVNKKMPNILGCGAGLKNTICLTRNREVFISQHIGNLDNVKSSHYFQTSIDHLKNMFDIQPEIIAHDMHPGYMSTQYAVQQSGIKKVAVQHHHAHAVSCMAEHHLDEPVIAVTLDGTGYGPDDTIWGGEILVCTRSRFKRKAHLSYLHMPGGDKAVTQPWRMAASLLYHVFGIDFVKLDIPYIHQMDAQQLSVVCQMMQKNLNSPLTSSAGRLFDAVSALLCIRHRVSHESQAAMEMESVAKMVAGDSCQDRYDYDIRQGRDDAQSMFEIQMQPCIRQVVEDIKNRIDNALISMKFHQTLVNAFADAAKQVRVQTGISKIVLSGGVFNNTIILEQMMSILEKSSFKVYAHTQVPTGDGGICLGQVVAAAAIQEGE